MAWEPQPTPNLVVLLDLGSRVLIARDIRGSSTRDISMWLPKLAVRIVRWPKPLALIATYLGTSLDGQSQ